MEVMEVMGMDVDIMVRERLKPSQDILEVMVVMVMVVDMEDMAMEVDTMARGKPKLWLRLSQDIFPEDMAMEDMVMVVMEVTGMDVDIMVRERLKPSQDILQV